MRVWFRNLVFAVLALAATSGRGADQGAAVGDESNSIAAIGECLRQNKEAVLLTDGVQCKDYRKGRDFLKEVTPGAPFDFDSDKECPKDTSPPVNKRRLGADAVQRLLKLEIGTHGIRIFGAIFCERVQLVGLELPFSLVIDKSVFNGGIEIRNLRAKSDLSFDGSLIFDQFRIIRSHIEGSLFGDGSFIDRLSMGNSTIDTSISFTESVLFESAQFYNVSIGRELSVRGSALSYFITQFSNINELLDLSHSQARCAYHINKSEIGYLVARRAGFGTVVPPPTLSEKNPRMYVWRDDSFTKTLKDMLLSPAVVKRVADPSNCVNLFERPYRAEFYIFDSTIKSSLCVSEFRWLAPRDTGPYTPQEWYRPRDQTLEYLRTVVAINGNTIGNNLIIDLWPNDPTAQNPIDYEVSQLLHRFEAIGVKAGGLVIDFKDTKQNHLTAVDGLQFERLYNAHASCEYGGSKTAPLIYDERTLSIISDFTETLELPKVENALKWLELNKIGSTQPYTAFATAFKNAGVDSAQIAIARENREVCERAARWLPLAVLRQLCTDAAERRESGTNISASKAPVMESKPADPPDQSNGWRQLGTTIVSIPNQLSDLALLLFRGALFFLADHGYRPGKVLWWVSLTLFLFWVWFLWPLKVIAYSSKSGSSTSQQPPVDIGKIRPVGFSFLFDRLLPAYQIDSAHYEIDSYFKRVPLSALSNRTPPPPMVRRLLFFEWPAERVTAQREVDRIENSLRVLRILGVVFAIFLAAAVSALVIH